MPIPKFITGFNKHVTNRLFLIIAGWLGPFSVINHVGRRSGHTFRTPVLAFPSGEGYVVALTYGRDVDWVKNLLAAGRGEVERGGLRVLVHSFRIASYEEAGSLFPLWIHPSLWMISLKDCLYMEKMPV
jgi:deazaflavin-dependent oxidoreductase (nitroreductase family)